MSNFHGLEMAKRALFAQQNALYTTGHNIANANTEGYSRQRVNFEADIAMPAASKNRMGIPGQIGTGVQIESIERIRNKFLDLQFRGENSLAGYWEKRAEALGRMEDVMNDLHETGLSAVMDDFWSALQDLAVNPTNAGARSVVVQRGIAFSETFNYINSQLTQIRSDIAEEINTTEKELNLILENIDSINEQIKALEVNGYVPNDLYDARDRYIDDLSKIIPITVEFEDSRKTSPGQVVDAKDTIKAQQGVAMVFLKVTNEDGSQGEIKLVDGITLEHAEISLVKEKSADGEDYFSGIQVKTGTDTHFTGINHNDSGPVMEKQKGTLQSLIQAYGYQDGTNVTGDYIEMQRALKQMAESFAKEFNELHNEGTPYMDYGGDNFFFDFKTDPTDPFAWQLVVMDHIKENPFHIAASPQGGERGGGAHAFKLAGLFDEPLDDLNQKSIRDFYAEKVGFLAVELADAERMNRNTGVLLTQIENSRQSVSSVSLDEEMTNMLKFQHAYNAAARTMTATDELLDRVINNMGLVGR